MAAMLITFMKERSEMGLKICQVAVDERISPIRLVKGISGWRAVFRRELHSPKLGHSITGEQVLTPDLPFREAKVFVINRVMFGGPEGLEPNPDEHFILPTLERVMPGEVAEGSRAR